jgi:4-hydroxybenzoate polyprenyltransferase
MINKESAEALNFHADRGRPLVVDLDGTLVRSDLLIETAISELVRRPQSLIAMLFSLGHGKAALKHCVARSADFDPALLPYDEAVLALIRQAANEGRPVYLASASNRRLVESVANYLGVFDDWFASDESNNLAGESKAQLLDAKFGMQGFDYIGNDLADMPVWARSAKAIVSRPSVGVARRLAESSVEAEYLPYEKPTWRTWSKLLRVHQYAKNALVFIPLVTSHELSFHTLFALCLAAISFSLCASSVYVMNDLIDLTADRAHLTKRKRPLANGAIPLFHGVLAVPILFILSLIVASFISVPFLAVILGYFALTSAYSFVLKRKMLIDVVVLAMLYAVRVLGGAVAINIVVSEWLWAFSIFIFMSLALIKRYVELTGRLDAGLPNPANRNYQIGDLNIIAALAAAAGFNAVTVFALYISSPAVHGLYRRPELLWLICPVLLYWIGRALMMANRRWMDDDPIAFAIRDKNSYLAAATIGLIMLAAI